MHGLLRAGGLVHVSENLFDHVAFACRGLEHLKLRRTSNVTIIRFKLNGLLVGGSSNPDGGMSIINEHCDLQTKSSLYTPAPPQSDRQSQSQRQGARWTRSDLRPKTIKMGQK
eukprot:6472703-Amphidinium_carterae.2